MLDHAEIEAFFDAYLTHWNARDFDAVADCYGAPASFVLPSGVVSLPDAAAKVAMLQNLFAQMEADGFSHTTLGPVAARSCGPDMVVADVPNVRRWRADGSLMEEIDGHYILQRQEGIWRAMVAVVCTPGWRG